MNVYITYDAHNGWSDIKPALIEAGFRDRWKGNDQKLYYLPNTSLWHNNLTGTDEAKQLFFSTIDTLNSQRAANDKIRVGRFIAVQWTNWSGIEGEPHS